MFFLTCMHIVHNPDHSSRAWGFPKWSVQNENEGLKRSLRWTSHKIVCRLWYLLTCRLQYLGLVGWYFHPSTKQGTPELNTRIEANSLGVCIPKGQILDDIHPNLSPNPSKSTQNSLKNLGICWPFGTQRESLWPGRWPKAGRPGRSKVGPAAEPPRNAAAIRGSPALSCTRWCWQQDAIHQVVWYGI